MIVIKNRTMSFSNYIDKLYPYIGEKKNLSINSPYCKMLTFQVTEDCNLRCSYCYQIKKSNNKMTLEMGKKIVDCLFKDNYKIEKYYSLDNMT